MATETICKPAWSMDAFRFVAKLPYKIIVEWLRDETTALSNTMAICARIRSRCSEDEITMGVWYLIFCVPVSNRPCRF
jgi:hypothetical protein